MSKKTCDSCWWHRTRSRHWFCVNGEIGFLRHRPENNTCTHYRSYSRVKGMEIVYTALLALLALGTISVLAFLWLYMEGVEIMEVIP